MGELTFQNHLINTLWQVRTDPRAMDNGLEALLLVMLSAASTAPPAQLYDGGDIGATSCRFISQNVYID